MKRLLILLILLFALPAYAQQCSEENPCPELARLSPAIVGGGVPVAGSTPALLLDYSGAEGALATTTNILWQFGSFIVAGTGTYTITSVKVRCVDASTNVGNTTMNIYADDAGNQRPTGAALSSKSVANSALPDSAADYEFVIASPRADFVKGTIYHIAICPDATGSTTVYDHIVASRAQGHSVNQGGAWLQDYTGYSMDFEIWGY